MYEICIFNDGLYIYIITNWTCNCILYNTIVLVVAFGTLVAGRSATRTRFGMLVTGRSATRTRFGTLVAGRSATLLWDVRQSDFELKI